MASRPKRRRTNSSSSPITQSEAQSSPSSPSPDVSAVFQSCMTQVMPTIEEAYRKPMESYFQRPSSSTGSPTTDFAQRPPFLNRGLTWYIQRGKPERNHITRLSKAVYVGMCCQVGMPTEVRIRREVLDTVDVINRPLQIKMGYERMRSGSVCEGFRLRTSDLDSMLWLSDHEVICDLSQISLYSTPQHTVILMEYEDLPPGSTRLMMLTPSSDQTVNSSCININGEIFINSSLFRAKYLKHEQSHNSIFGSYVQHGPCVSHKFLEGEVDHAYCLRSNHWPNLASPWIQRCQRKHWPPHGALSAIIKKGCHVVPISSEPLNPEKDTEWRISFTVAEQKLFYSMNHCQFLCYGLLKIFLKEVINAGNDDAILCSYFMKTVVFWVIQNDSLMEWIPSNLLTCFWTCFKLLLSCVYKGECPNFFIPQNNMFRVKVVGQRQAALFDQLYDLYCKGIQCLLLSPTIGGFLKMATLNRMLKFNTNECEMISDIYLDICLFQEIDWDLSLSVANEEECALLIIAIEHLLKTRLTASQTMAVQRCLSCLFRNFSFLMLSQSMEILSNKNRTHIYRKSVNMMKIALKIGCASDILYLAMYYYRNCQYEKSLRCLHRAHKRMSKPYVVYDHPVNGDMYRRAVKGLSLSEKIRKCLILNIFLHSKYVYIDELVPEQEAHEADSGSIMLIPPLVMLHMLFVLNHHRLGDTVGSRQSIQDLHNLLLNDEGNYISRLLRNISWQILGICQETCGDYVEALKSFQCSLQQQSSYNYIQKATMTRMQNDRHRCAITS